MTRIAALIVALCCLHAACEAATWRSPAAEAPLRRVKRIIGASSRVTDWQLRNIFSSAVTLHGHVTQVSHTKLWFVNVPVFSYSSIHCGASVVHENYVVTAAHCVCDNSGKLLNTNRWRVYMHGANRKPGLYQRFKSWVARQLAKVAGDSMADGVAKHAHVLQVFVHPRYNSTTLRNDIAVLRTTRIKFSGRPHVSAARLPQHTSQTETLPPPNADCHFAGWGCTEFEGGVEQHLLSVGFRTQPLAECQRWYGAAYEQWRGRLCVVGDSATVCPGDSGGGLLCRDSDSRLYLAGIASSSASGPEPEMYPANFVQVSWYRRWIDSVIGQ